ncbi:hypothetical protein BVRB_1g014980 [Beta vulgaris subsp. vulgaris]|nr:hypothetical protein BVRB_1g014980 [Beta vulgaris subsp. vulgaris]
MMISALKLPNMQNCRNSKSRTQPSAEQQPKRIKSTVAHQRTIIKLKLLRLIITMWDALASKET